MSRLIVALFVVLAIPSAWGNSDLETIHNIQRQVAELIHQGRSMAPLRGGQNQLTAECWRTMKAHQAKAKELREQNNPISPRLFLGASVDLDSAIVKVESCVSCLPNAKSYCDAAQKYLKASEKDIAQSKQPLPKGPVDVKLPPVSKRKIIGTWFVDWGTSPLTRSIEKVHSKYYMVKRFIDHTGGDTGKQLARIKPHTFRPIPPDSSGDYFVIKKDGTLALMDDEGLIDVLPKNYGLWPTDEH